MKTDEILSKWVLQSAARHCLPNGRTSNCLRRPIPGRNTVDVHATFERAKFVGLQVCDSVWSCPICSQRIAMGRSNELAFAVAKWFDEYGWVAMLTLTARHSRGDSLKKTIDTILESYRALTSGKRFQGWKKSGWVHSVRATEITWGEKNGWHPHFHILMFLNPMSNVAWGDMKSKISTAWLAELAKVGGDGVEGVAANFIVADVEIYDYITKYGRIQPRSWGVHAELAMSVSKRVSKRDGITPFGMLEKIANGDKAKMHTYLFREYAETMAGKQQLVWSAGLKALLLVADTNDAEIDLAPEAPLFAQITLPQWRVIMARDKDQRGQILELARKGEIGEFWKLVLGGGWD